ncbi:hypothetical protein AG1IA_06865 [Rhizoctonia solani AG-1 IA]|uniref:Uncharacterized protein n=1 Tax=Thanatephorus cucumeris (strain AG1-IA) TaxID=983506 RepID=L8WRU2_THACA|nr:hypothetical protein AG1IA_06865 [Rhizoctonia solani AG-1 IA]
MGRGEVGGIDVNASSLRDARKRRTVSGGIMGRYQLDGKASVRGFAVSTIDFPLCFHFDWSPPTRTEWFDFQDTADLTCKPAVWLAEVRVCLTMPGPYISNIRISSACCNTPLPHAWLKYLVGGD